VNWTYEEWKRVVWTDESSFSTTGFGHRLWIIRKPDVEYHTNSVDETFEQEQSSKMIWGGFCGSLKSNLVCIPGKAKLDSATYVAKVMEPHLVPFCHQCCEENGWTVVVEDGAPGHKKHAITYRNLNGMDAIQWPAQSPDLNLIEALWMDMETELGEIWGRVGDVEALELCLKAAWERCISEERLEELIRSMPARLQAVIDADGGAIPY